MGTLGSLLHMSFYRLINSRSLLQSEPIKYKNITSMIDSSDKQNKHMFTISPFGRSRCCNYIQCCLGQTSLGTSASTSSSTSATGGISIFRRRCFSSWCFSLRGCRSCRRNIVVTERPIIVVILSACARSLEDSNRTRVNTIEHITSLLVQLQK